MSISPPLEELPPPRYPTGEDTLLRKASMHLFISLFPSVSICLFAALWLKDAILPRLGYLKCGRYHENPLPCRFIPLPILLAISTFVFNTFTLYKLGMRKNPKSVGVSGAIASALAEEENRTQDETTPLLAGTGANGVGDGGTESPQPAPIPHDVLAWTALFSTLWTLLPLATLVSIATGVTERPSWDPRDAEAWGALAVLLAVQMWTTSIAAFAFARLRMVDVGHSEQRPVTMIPRPIVPDTQTRVKLTHSLMLLALLPLIMLEGNVIFFILFIVSLILNIGFLTALDLRMVLRQSTIVRATRPLSQQQVGEPTSYPLRQASFTLISACTFILALTWTSWFILTVVSATLSMLRDTFPDWNIVHLPIPARGWEPSVWLESVADLWLGWTLGNVALCAWTELRVGED